MDNKTRTLHKFFTATGVMCILVASVIFVDIIYKEYKAKVLSLQALKVLESQVDVDEFKLKNEGRMPTIEIDRNKYIGILTIPKINMNLPIQGDWSYDKLDISPCKYNGSASEDSMILMGHNYKSQFSPIKGLDIGDEVIFTDVDSIEYIYEVSDRETIYKTQVEAMISGEWDLTLFTCDYTGTKRTTIRCQRKI